MKCVDCSTELTPAEARLQFLLAIEDRGRCANCVEAKMTDQEKADAAALSEQVEGKVVVLHTDFGAPIVLESEAEVDR